MCTLVLLDYPWPWRPFRKRSQHSELLSDIMQLRWLSPSPLSGSLN